MASLEDEDNVPLSEMSDEELQEAFAAGVLKPGLNVRVEEKVYKNNVAGLKQKLKDISSKLKWIERMDLEVQPAPVAPELHFEVNEKEKENVVNLKSRMRLPIKQQVALDDFKREVLFHRQAQSAVLQGIPRLKALGVPTQRPDDYFAEMMKSDKHMQKVRQSLAAKQAGAVMAEKVSQLRKLKKLGKQIQIENKLKQQSEKKKMLEEVKKYRKGVRKDLDFLDTKKSKSKGSAISKKQKVKFDKYGFGGKKKGSKRNTKESAAAFGSSVKKGKGNNNKRLGKSRRLKKKSRK
ncbi:UNVERIFIED_CONTAM: hypothetical protein PYX00_006502 [Menopon gallinae]|uniref:rRNA-processing protein EBP2 homolog n=1 Tax=Menopon gallinae TaxID=328185 RepID=A0AAW2HVI4_9NEOP